MSNKKPPTPPPKTVILYRNSGNGQFVTPAYANTHKPTTEREVRKVLPDRSSSTRSRGR